MTDELGPLAAALAKAQSSFPSIARDKEVTVQTKTGGSYKFKYAPLDSILNAVRGPLSSNGLALVQLLDDGDLVTMLMHDSGAKVAGRVSLPTVDGGVQAFGSAITYLRRYSIQAILGIAAEEDDDGNHASGNAATFTARRQDVVSGLVGTDAHPAPSVTADGGLIGTLIAEGKYDFELRQTPDGGWRLPFRIKDGAKSFIALAEDDLAQALKAIGPTVLGQRVTVWGNWSDEHIPAKGSKPEIRYRILHLDRIQTPDGRLPALDLDEDLAAVADEVFPQAASMSVRVG